MWEYFDESISRKVPLKIITSRKKEMIVFVVKYSDDRLYYSFEDSYETMSNIFISNITEVDFANKEEKECFCFKKIGFSKDINNYLSYYLTCVQELEKNSGYTFREEMFKVILDSVCLQNSDNLLVKFLKNQKDNKNMYFQNNLYLLSNSNLSQREAISNALNNDVSIIQGPPGTGKTTTILSLIANFIMEGKNVVVVSKNNSAVENIIEDFSKTALPEFYLRFGSRDEYMTPLKSIISSKIDSLKKILNQIPNANDSFEKIYKVQDELENLEKEIDELVSVKNLLVDLKTQKKFMDKEQELYNFKELLTDNEMKIVCEKNASVNRLVKIFEYSKKHKFNFFQRLIIRYYYCIKNGNINEKFYAISQLLKEVYIKKEIAEREYLLLERHLEEKQNRVKQLYNEYIEICMTCFQQHLKQSMLLGLDKVKNYDLMNLAFNVYPLILTTADAFLSNFKEYINSSKKIDVIIIDEASQCDVLTGLPLLYTAKKLVIVGDEKQLSAITNLKVDTDIPLDYRYENNTFLNAVKNVMEPIEKTLEEHYRCDYNIISFCNKFYYDNQLKIYTDSTPSSIKIMDANKYKGTERKNGSFCNQRECYTIEGVVDKNSDYFVITPFKEQGNELKKRFEPLRAGTIHTFQGKGANDVYFSTVLNDLSICDNHIEGDHNLFSAELINVAVSRAKKKFFLITDKQYFQKNSAFVPDVNNLIDYIKIYGEEIDDDTSCWYDYLYKSIPYYEKTQLYDNIYEEETHQAINSILESTPYICKAKIYLTELILNEDFLNKNPNIRKYIQNRAHADFTIFDTRTGKLKIAIELDGKDHNKEEQIKRDDYKNQAFKAVSVPLLRIKSKEDINDQKFKEKLKQYIEIN